MGSYQNGFGGYSSNTNQDLNFSISSSKLSSNDSYEVQESEVPHIVNPPFNPSESNPSPGDGGSVPGGGRRSRTCPHEVSLHRREVWCHGGRT